MSKEKQINNTFQIKEEMLSRNIKKTFYIPPKARKFRFWGRSGNVKIYTPEEIIVYRMKQIAPTFFGGN